MPFFLTKKNVEEKRLGIYIHIPFCKSKCEYCDFYSVGGRIEESMTDRYLQALADHMKETGKLAPGYVSIRSISAAAHPATSARKISNAFSTRCIAISV